MEFVTWFCGLQEDIFITSSVKNSTAGKVQKEVLKEKEIVTKTVVLF